MLIDERGNVVDFVVDDNVKVVLGVMGGDIRVGKLFGHGNCWESSR